jgi:hypothetical protein
MDARKAGDGTQASAFHEQIENFELVPWIKMIRHSRLAGLRRIG